MARCAVAASIDGRRRSSCGRRAGASDAREAIAAYGSGPAPVFMEITLYHITAVLSNVSPL